MREIKQDKDWGIGQWEEVGSGGKKQFYVLKRLMCIVRIFLKSV